jgi:5-methylcytosine-specific restriction endonuclease McrA
MGTREKVRQLRDDGLSLTRIAAELGLSKSTVCYHVRRLGEAPDDRFTRRYDWAEVQAYYDVGHSITECQQRFGFARESWNDARKRGDVRSRPKALALEQLLVVGPLRNRRNLKTRLIAAGLRTGCCEGCGIAQWRGGPLTLALHHINGNGRDNRIENLQILCPNCHSQTENFAGRNVARLRASDALEVEAPAA